MTGQGDAPAGQVDVIQGELANGPGAGGVHGRQSDGQALGGSHGRLSGSLDLLSSQRNSAPAGPLPTRALECFLAGHWGDAVAEIETDTGLADAPGESYLLLLIRGVLSLIRLHRNDLPDARDAIGAAPGELPGAGYRDDWLAWAQALLLEADGELTDALETLPRPAQGP